MFKVKGKIADLPVHHYSFLLFDLPQFCLFPIK